ncbi:MAG: transcription elongation factor [Labilithrix sp.]|nr:transcription elongation factor [Labilithrix sp.]
MPEKKTIARARKAKREGKALTTQAGEFVREEIEHIREGKHGAKNAKQAIAIGLSKARRAGVKLPAAKGASTSERTRKEAKRGTKAKPKAARRKSPKRTQSLKSPAAKRSRAATKALRRAPRASASHRALSRQARQAPRRRKRASGSRSRTKRAATAD